jgi:hypothetical protein
MWAASFQIIRDRGNLTAASVIKWMKSEKIPLGQTLEWLQSIPGFKKKNDYRWQP